MTLAVVDQPTFDAIECNRCGLCCETFTVGADEDNERGYWRHHGPLGWLELYARHDEQVRHFNPMDAMLFFGQLIPKRLENGTYQYRCGYYSRNTDNQGLCAVYDERPKMCSEFPYGKPTLQFDRCAWRVVLIDFEPVQGVWT